MARLNIILGSRQRRTVVALHPGWIPILAIIAWLGAMWQGPQAYPEQDLQGRWLLGAALAVAALVSVAFREGVRLAILRRAAAGANRHLALRPYGGTVRPRPSGLSWRRQAALALLGPLASAGLGLFFGVLWLWLGQPFYGWLALLNLGLATFTLAPVRPLDGAFLLEALSRQTQLEESLVVRATFHGGHLLAAALIWLGGLSLLLTQFPPGLLLVALGFLMQLQLRDEPAADEPDLEQQQLLNGYSVRDVVQHTRQGGGRSPATRLPRRPAQPLGGQTGSLPLDPESGGSDGSALPLRQGPAVHSRVISITAELSSAWRKLHEQNAQTLLVVDDYCIVGVCSREQLLAYLRSLAREKEKESE